ncbi:hypothetical protein AWC04_03885 [Mycolicibacterium fallax]|uniref:Uncharacterized protein n=2 Tax=Mycolicibacterium fallax TaxID=1793 RepID=A0A1X1RJ21_MYCFA|nr:hypothetical protein AWC04_03885 [Mycolicibacterium fallax]
MSAMTAEMVVNVLSAIPSPIPLPTVEEVAAYLRRDVPQCPVCAWIAPLNVRDCPACMIRERVPL